MRLRQSREAPVSESHCSRLHPASPTSHFQAARGWPPSLRPRADNEGRQELVDPDRSSHRAIPTAPHVSSERDAWISNSRKGCSQAPAAHHVREKCVQAVTKCRCLPAREGLDLVKKQASERIPSKPRNRCCALRMPALFAVAPIEAARTD